jgi:hypothetical protein
MSRSLYVLLIRLHPADFRERFADEMLWIFEQEAAFAGGLPLLADGLTSLLRQRILRTGAWWKIAVAALGGVLSIAAVLVIIGPV